MGEQNVNEDLGLQQLGSFMQHLLADIRALEQMLSEDWIESGIRRIGAEQEFFLVNPAWRPAPQAMEVLSQLDDHRYTTELARFNLEINMDPLEFGGDCLARMERQLTDLLAKVRAAAQRCGAEVVLTGILPTIRKSDLNLANMTPRPRYQALDRALHALRDGDTEFRLKGVDELIVKHDSLMLEACCTSFQIHYQVSASEFVNFYNLAQVITAPVLAAATNSPILFGRRLWKETRIPLFQQAVDTRNANYHLRERSPRVSFGQQWVKQSVLDLFREDIARFRVLLGAPLDEDPYAQLRKGIPPELKALRIHNGTVYRWNRPCYGILNGKPHLRIETRALPAGPSVLDEIANAAFFYGLLTGFSAEQADITQVMDFNHARANFAAAAQWGLDAQFTWLGGQVVPAQELIMRQLLPLAREGLRRAGIQPEDTTRYLDVIEARVASGRTGAQWLLSSFTHMKKPDSKDCELLSAVTAAAVRRQWEGEPVHQWPLAVLEDGLLDKQGYLRVEEFMTTDLFTVDPDEPVDLVASLMDWKHIRHVPVEDAQGHLAGMISCFEVMRHYSRNLGREQANPVVVSSIMNKYPITIPPEASTLEAIARMRREKVDCLAVVNDKRLVGIITERDFINLAARLLEVKSEERGERSEERRARSEERGARSEKRRARSEGRRANGE